jgi:hypothetical protein
LNADIGETKNVMEGNPEVVESLTEIAIEFDRQLGEEMRPACGVNGG